MLCGFGSPPPPLHWEKCRKTRKCIRCDSQIGSMHTNSALRPILCVPGEALIARVVDESMGGGLGYEECRSLEERDHRHVVADERVGSIEQGETLGLVQLTIGLVDEPVDGVVAIERGAVRALARKDLDHVVRVE